MRHLIGLLMAVFQVFATLHISGRRKKELETRELYLLDDRVIIRHGPEAVGFVSCLFPERRSDRLLSHYFNPCYHRLWINYQAYEYSPHSCLRSLVE